MKVLKYLVSIVIGGLGLFFLYRYFFPSTVDDKKESEIENLFWTKTTCVPPSSTDWTTWLKGGSKGISFKDVSENIAKTYFGGEQERSAAVAGFFKGINVYPSLKAAKHYKEYMLAWVKHPIGGIPSEGMQIGELRCKKRWDEGLEINIDNEIDELEEALKELDLSQLPSEEEIRQNIEKMKNGWG